jgi:hypothetical protein
VSPAATSGKPDGLGAFWSLRVLESGLLLTSLVGIGMFAWSLVDILRIESAKVVTKELPPTAWPGVFIFFGSMVLLQVVRVVLHRYRGDNGAPRAPRAPLSAAAATTAAVLAAVPDESAPASQAAEIQGEG